MNETEKAMEHDREMECKYEAHGPMNNCIKFAAKILGVSEESTYIVMFAFVLGGYKALCSSSEVHDDHGHYVEVVYNDIYDEFYVIKYEETSRATFVKESVKYGKEKD